jgi:hypothetical protein
MAKVDGEGLGPAKTLVCLKDRVNAKVSNNPPAASNFKWEVFMSRLSKFGLVLQLGIGAIEVGVRAEPDVCP